VLRGSSLFLRVPQTSKSVVVPSVGKVKMEGGWKGARKGFREERTM